MSSWPGPHSRWTAEQHQWIDRYPGHHDMPVSRAMPCWVCKEPGYIVPCPPETPVATSGDGGTLDDAPVIHTEFTCAGHEYTVRQYLAYQFAPRLFARYKYDAEMDVQEYETREAAKRAGLRP